MITLLVLLLILALIIGVVVIVVIGGGFAFLIVFGDLIVAIAVIKAIVRHLIVKK